MTKSILSAGMVLRAMLLASKEVTEITKRVYPIMSEEGKFPYIVYRRSGIEATHVTDGRPSDLAHFDVWCYADNYGESVALAEAARSALDSRSGEINGLRIRRFEVVDASEDIATNTGAKVQILKVTAKI